MTNQERMKHKWTENTTDAIEAWICGLCGEMSETKSESTCSGCHACEDTGIAFGKSPCDVCGKERGN